MDDSRQTIRFQIGGPWSAEDMGGMLLALSDLYCLRFMLELLEDEWRVLDRYYDDFAHRFPFPSRRRRRFLSLGLIPWETGLFGVNLPALDEPHLARVSQSLEPEERLLVRRASYASPGSIDLIGIGAVVGHVKDFAVKLIDRHDSKRQRELSDERAALENDRMRIQNARDFVALAKELGYSEIEIRHMVSQVDEKQQVLDRLAGDRKLIGVTVPDDADESQQ